MLLPLVACAAPSPLEIASGAEDLPGSTKAASGGLTTDKATYVVGERIQVAFDDAVGSDSDWIGLYPAAQASNVGSTAWLYTTGSQVPGTVGTSGSVRFLPVSLPAGTWEARLFHDDGYDLTDSVRFRVRDPGEIVAPSPTGDLTVMTFNSWLDGTAVTDGVAKIAAAVVACGAQVVAFQEGGRSFAAQITTALAAEDPAWVGADVVDDGADNVIVSQLPITSSAAVGGGYGLLATVQTDFGDITVAGTHFDYTEYGPYLARDGATAATIVRTERRVRGDDATRVLAEVEGAALVLGDHNAPSHLDWTRANTDQNFGLVVRWPTSVAFQSAGFVDAYRAMNPNPVRDRGFTWTAGYPKATFDGDEVHDRIDFVYARDGDVTFVPVAAYVYDADPWPSDHRAVVVSYELGG